MTGIAIDKRVSVVAFQLDEEKFKIKLEQSTTTKISKGADRNLEKKKEKKFNSHLLATKRPILCFWCQTKVSVIQERTIET